jgi:hypothetical protein
VARAPLSENVRDLKPGQKNPIESTGSPTACFLFRTSLKQGWQKPGFFFNPTRVGFVLGFIGFIGVFEFLNLFF